MTSESNVPQDYRLALRDLTFNSKPIITNLSVMAANAGDPHVPAISAVIIEHLVSCPLSMKLPALYLVDSICKNVGGLYIVEFEPLISERLPQLFSSLMDDQIRKDILRTLDTWDSIFSSHTVQKLHKFIGNSPTIEKIQENKRALPAADPRAMRFTGKLDFSDNATGGPRKRPNFEPVPRNFDPRIYNQNPSVSAIKSNVFTPNFHNNQRLPPTQQIPQASTIPRILSKPITEMLTDLRAMMTVTPHLYRPQEVGGLMMALQRECHACGEDAFFHTVDSRARLPDKRPLVELIDAQLSADHLIRKTSFEHVYPIRPVSQSYNYLDLNMTAPLESHLDKPIELASTNVQNSISTPQYSIPDTLFTNGLPFDVAPLLASLSANLPFGLNINPSSIPPIPRPIAPKEPPIRPVYEDIIINRKGSHKLLYDDLPRQCKICALRFPDTNDGSTKMQKHLDEHFHRNIRLKDKARKVISRLWMQRETEWISNLKTVDIEEQTAMFEDNAENNGIKSTNDYLKNAHKSFKGINVPAGADTNSFDRACVLCKDRIEVVWDHEQDEWVYPNVVKISNQEIAHASCTVTSTDARIRSVNLEPF